MATAAPPAPAPVAPAVADAQKRVKTKTLEGLKSARMRPWQPTYFMLCIGNKGAVPYLAPVIRSGHKSLIRPLMGKDTGLKYHRGQCIYENGCYTFVGPTVVAGMKRKLEAGLLVLTGRRFRTMVRRGDVEESQQKSSAELTS
jgi:hypothetical protein